MNLWDLISRVFVKENTPSKEVAKERLRLVLVHDRSSLSPEILPKLKEGLIDLISQYLEIDEEALQVSLENEENAIALVANIPIKGLRKAAN
jgi:cell division topological specificity factor